MSWLYQYFLTTFLLVAIATFSVLEFYPRTQPYPSIGVNSAIDRTYALTLWYAKSRENCCAVTMVWYGIVNVILYSAIITKSLMR